MHLHFRFAVLERVLGNLGLVRKFAALPDRHKADTKFICNGRSKQKAARIDPDNLVDLNATTSFQKEIHRATEQHRIIQYRGDVLKHDAFLRKIGYVAHSGAESSDNS